MPLDDTRTAAKALGGTLNTAFLTVAATAAGEYHRRLGQPVEQLRASMVISTRTEASGANAYTLARMLVPTGEMPITERFAAVAAAVETARMSSATANLDTLASVAATLPVSLVSRIVRQQTQTVDFATSNLRAAPFPVYIAGAKRHRELPHRPPGRRGVQPHAACRTTEASTWASTSTRWRSSSPRCSVNCCRTPSAPWRAPAR